MVNIYEYPNDYDALFEPFPTMLVVFYPFVLPQNTKQKKGRLLNPRKDTDPKSDKKHLHQNYPLGVKLFIAADGKC